MWGRKLPFPILKASGLYNSLYYRTSREDYIARGCEKLAQGFYTATTWLEIEPSIYDTPVRRSTSKLPSDMQKVQLAKYQI